MTVAIWIGVAIAAIAIVSTWKNIYFEGMSRYMYYKNVEQQFTVLKMQRNTILEEILNQLHVWGDYEREVIIKAAETSSATNLLTERFPSIQTMGSVNMYIAELKTVERRINEILQARIAAASKWYEMDRNLFLHWAMPRRSKEIPSNLLGYVLDPKIPQNELNAMMTDYR